MTLTKKDTSYTCDSNVCYNCKNYIKDIHSYMWGKCGILDEGKDSNGYFTYIVYAYCTCSKFEPTLN